MNFCLINVRFRNNGPVYTYKTDAGVSVGDKVSVYSWVSQGKISLNVEEVLPFDGKGSFTYVKKT